MGLKHDITFLCDTCDTNYLIDIDDNSMDMPPGWLGMQIVVADGEGAIPDQENEIFCHFCSHACLVEYTQGEEMKNRLILASREIKEDNEDENFGYNME